MLQPIIRGQIARDFLSERLERILHRARLTTNRNGGDVGEISSHARRIDDIVERKLVEKRASFQQETERLIDVQLAAPGVVREGSPYLSDAAGSSKNGCE